MVAKAKEFFKFNSEISLRDVFLLLSFIGTLFWWGHNIEMKNADIITRHEILCGEVQHNRTLEDKRYERQAKQIADNSRTSFKIDTLITEIKLLNKKVEDLIDGKYKIKQ